MRRTLCLPLCSLLVLVSLALAAAPVDVNTATEQELMTLPGVGPARAQAIIQHREQHGPFRSLDDLDAVPGIGPATLRGLQGAVTFGASGEVAAPVPAPPDAAASTTALDINTATVEQLQTLPGIGRARAQAIVDERTQNGPFTSVDDLARVQGVGPATVNNLRSLITVTSPGAAARAVSAEAP